jgi:HSP20 family protein
MDIKKLAPWNWFKKEEEEAAKVVPVHGRTPAREYGYGHDHPVTRIHREIDRIFDSAFRDFGLSPFGSERSIFPGSIDEILKPTVDIGATDDAYTISVEIPGVDEKDVRLELSGSALTIRGEKRQEKEDKNKNFYRVERAYGAFQRVLSLPEDVDQDDIRATFRKGILTITVPRKAALKADVRRIEIRSAD